MYEHRSPLLLLLVFLKFQIQRKMYCLRTTMHMHIHRARLSRKALGAVLRRPIHLDLL